MGVVQAQWVFLRRQVVAQHQVKLIIRPPPPGNGRNRIMGDSLCLRQNHRGLVGITAPRRQNPSSQFHQPFRVGRRETQHRHGPVDNPRRHIRKARERIGGLHLRFLHRKHIASPLEMVVRQDRAAHNGQIRVGADKIMGKLPHKVQQLFKAGPVNLHRRMDAVKTNTVLIVINIGRILKIPGRPLYGNGDQPVVLPRRMIQAARVALVFRAEQTPRVVGGRQLPRCGNCFWVFLRL